MRPLLFLLPALVVLAFAAMYFIAGSNSGEVTRHQKYSAQLHRDTVRFLDSLIQRDELGLPFLTSEEQERAAELSDAFWKTTKE